MKATKKTAKTAKKQTAKKTVSHLMSAAQRSDRSRIAANVAHATMTATNEYERKNLAERKEYLREANVLIRAYNKKYRANVELAA